MKNKITVFMLAAALMAPAASLWASAGDSTIQGPTGTTAGTSKPCTKTKCHGHHSKKPETPATSNTSATPNTPATK